MSSHPFKAAIFDLGGVLIDWNPRYLYRKLFPGNEAAMERFLADVVSPDWNRELDRGGFFQARVDELKAEHPAQAELIQFYLDRFPEMLGGVDAGTVAILHDLRARGLRLFALSNWAAETFAMARGLVAELGVFDDILISGETGRLKPERQIYEMALARFGVAAAEAFYVDDVPANAEGARAVGLTAISFTDADALRLELERLKVL